MAELIRQTEIMHRVGEMSERDFRTTRFCGDNECPATGKDDTGAPLFEFKKQLDTLGRGYPACTAVLASNKSKIFKPQDVVAIEAKLQAEIDARGPATKEASRLRGDLTYKNKEQEKRNEMAAQALHLIGSLVTRPLFARFQPLIDAAKADTERPSRASRPSCSSATPRYARAPSAPASSATSLWPSSSRGA